jgi:uncharacterized spore protein YtfJ
MAGLKNAESMTGIFDHLEKMLTAKSVFGEPITVGDVVLVPVVDIAFGAGAGGRSSTEKGEPIEGGGSGAGARLTASAVIVVRESQVQVMKLKETTAIDRILELVPDVVTSLKKDKQVAVKIDSEDKVVEK